MIIYQGSEQPSEIGHCPIKMLYVRHSRMKAGQFVLYSIIEYHMRKILYIKTRLTYDIAYYKNIIKSLYTFIQQTIK